LELLETAINAGDCLANPGFGRSRQKLPALAPNRVVAGRLPAKNQVMLLRASGSLTFVGNMNEDMGCAILNGASLLLGILKSLVEISGLSDVKGNPVAAFRLFGANVIARHWLERSADGINLIWILLARLARPTNRRRIFYILCFVATT
jgi:hypothetical protein